MATKIRTLHEKIADKKAVVGILGLGYVGLWWWFPQCLMRRSGRL